VSRAQAVGWCRVDGVVGSRVGVEGGRGEGGVGGGGRRGGEGGGGRGRGRRG